MMSELYVSEVMFDFGINYPMLGVVTRVSRSEELNLPEHIVESSGYPLGLKEKTKKNFAVGRSVIHY